jgi:hypothetical protein
VTLKTAEHASLQTAWEEYGRRLGRALPPPPESPLRAQCRARC